MQKKTRNVQMNYGTNGETYERTANGDADGAQNKSNLGLSWANHIEFA